MKSPFIQLTVNMILLIFLIYPGVPKEPHPSELNDDKVCGSGAVSIHDPIQHTNLCGWKGSWNSPHPVPTPSGTLYLEEPENVPLSLFHVHVPETELPSILPLKLVPSLDVPEKEPSDDIWSINAVAPSSP